jgi:hypothetical protein
MENVSFIPTKISQAAQEAQLGEPGRTFVLDVQGVRASFNISISILCFCFIGFCSTIVFLLMRRDSWGAYIYILLVVWLVPLLIFSYGLKAFRVWRKGGEYAVHLYEHGIIASLLWQGQWYLDVISWKHVLTTWLTWGQGYLVVYEKTAGQEALIHLKKGIKDWVLLVTEMRTQVMRVKLAKLIEAFERGEQCSFPQLRGWNEERAIVEPGFLIIQQGLRYKSQFLSWSNVVSIEIKGKQIMIMGRNGSITSWVSTSARLIADVEVLVALVSHILNRRNKSLQS